MIYIPARGKYSTALETGPLAKSNGSPPSNYNLVEQ
jgi:hypothetical protein